MKGAVLALDQGTTSSRAFLFDGEGALLASAQREVRQFFPQPGWVEHDPREIWETQYAVAEEALRKSGLRAGEVAAIGIANQRETAIVWDRRTGEPIHRAIVWQDRRTAPFCERLAAEGLEPLFAERTGLVLDPYFSASKVCWILDHVPGARQRAERGELAFGTVDSWLIWNLTGGARHVTDASNASRTLFYHLGENRWDAELLEVLAIPPPLLPEIAPSSGVCGEAAVGLLKGAPVAGIAGDQQAALFGQGCFEAGMAKNTYGTGCFLLMNTGAEPRRSQNRLLGTVAWRLEEETAFALEGSVFVGGAVVQWLRDGLGVIRDSSEVEALAASVPDNGGVYLVPAFAGLGAPHWDPHARGALLGLTRGTTAGHLARAALEGIAFQCADLIEAMERDAGFPITELRVDGGASRNDLLMQFQADLLQKPVVRPAFVETTALGAAWLAGLGTGLWKEREALAATGRAERRFEPGRPAAAMAAMREKWHEAVRRSVAWEPAPR